MRRKKEPGIFDDYKSTLVKLARKTIDDVFSGTEQELDGKLDMMGELEQDIKALSQKYSHKPTGEQAEAYGPAQGDESKARRGKPITKVGVKKYIIQNYRMGNHFTSDDIVENTGAPMGLVRQVLRYMRDKDHALSNPEPKQWEVVYIFNRGTIEKQALDMIGGEGKTATAEKIQELSDLPASKRKSIGKYLVKAAKAHGLGHEKVKGKVVLYKDRPAYLTPKEEILSFINQEAKRRSDGRKEVLAALVYEHFDPKYNPRQIFGSLRSDYQLDKDQVQPRFVSKK